MNEYQFRRLVKFFNAKHMENDPIPEWDANSLANLHRYNKENTAWKLLDKNLEDAIIVVGASPCLSEDVKELAKLEQHPLRKRFIVIVVNAALKLCLEHGVKPDYVIAIDGNPRTIVDDLDCDNENLVLLCTNSVSPDIFKVWKGKDVWWIPYYSLSREVSQKVRNKLGKKMPTGGNNFSSAMAFGYGILGSRIYIMVGCEHCYDDHYYFGDKESKWEETSAVSHWKAKDINGRDRWTNIPLWQYKIWIEKMVQELPHCVFIDTSWGIIGTDNDHVRHESLEDAINETVRAFEISEKAKHDPITNEKLRYDAAYTTGKYIPRIGLDFWKKMLKMYDFSKARTMLDVGTGIGQVVATLRNKGFEAYGTDISSATREYWKAGNISKFCTVCPADKLPYPDNNFDVVSCTEVLEHIPEENVLASLKEIYRVGRGDFIMTYALGKAFHKMPFDASEPHVCIKSIDWWNDRVEDAGFNIVSSIINPHQSSGVIYATKGIKDDQGKMPSGTLYVQSRQGVPLTGNFAHFQGRH
jgi:protein-L-isoaspartate O-methyltransferase